jgi:hypothetical protein
MSSKKYKSCILTSYLTLKRHPQCMDINNKILGIDGSGRVISDSFSYIEAFYNSVKGKDIEVVIFHDNLSKGFTEAYRAENISFERVPISSYSNNDYRFMYYLSWLRLNKYTNVFMTDVADVTISSPLSEISIDCDIFFCGDSIKLKDYMFESTKYISLHERFNWDNIDSFRDPSLDLLNMGVIGSNYSNAIKFLALFTEHRIKCGYPELNINMSLGNYIARNFFGSVKSGAPYCSVFKKYQKERKDVFFIHK